jgi:hypothetical protein
MLAQPSSNEILQPPRTVSVANNFNAPFAFPVEDKVAAHPPRADVGADVNPFDTQAGIIGQLAAFLIECIEQPVGSAEIVLGDISPDLDQILFGLSRAGQTTWRHVIVLSSGVGVPQL